MSNIETKTFQGVLWTFLEQSSNKIIGFVIQIILARLLMPEDFGLIAMVVVFIGIGTSIMESGFGQSLIRTKNPSESDYSSIFYLNVFISIIIYGFLYLLAPYVSDFYNEGNLTLILRILGLIIIFKSLYLVQQTILTINLDFRKQMMINLISTIASGLVATILAYQGFGVWSLVFYQLITNLLSAFLFWYNSKWFPKYIFDLRRIRYHYIFGYKLMLSTIINSVFNYIFDILIGKFYSSSQLGFYNRASTFQKFPTMLLGRSVNRVTYPVFSKISESHDQMKKALRKINKLVMYVYTPLVLLLLFNAKQIIVLLLSEKWLAAVPIFQLLCVGGLFQPIQYYNTNIILSLGDSALILKINFFSRLFILIGIVLVINYGFYYLIIFQAMSMTIITLSFMQLSGMKVGYSLFEQFKDIAANFSVGFLISFSCYCLISLLNISAIWSITVYLLSFISFYMILSQILKLESYLLIKKLIGSKLLNNIKK